jgi:hypothetical protein
MLKRISCSWLYSYMHENRSIHHEYSLSLSLLAIVIAFSCFWTYWYENCCRTWFRFLHYLTWNFHHQISQIFKIMDLEFKENKMTTLSIHPRLSNERLLREKWRKVINIQEYNNNHQGFSCISKYATHS